LATGPTTLPSGRMVNTHNVCVSRTWVDASRFELWPKVDFTSFLFVVNQDEVCVMRIKEAVGRIRLLLVYWDVAIRHRKLLLYTPSCTAWPHVGYVRDFCAACCTYATRMTSFSPSVRQFVYIVGGLHWCTSISANADGPRHAAWRKIYYIALHAECNKSVSQSSVILY